MRACYLIYGACTCTVTSSLHVVGRARARPSFLFVPSFRSTVILIYISGTQSTHRYMEARAERNDFFTHVLDSCRSSEPKDVRTSDAGWLPCAWPPASLIVDNLDLVEVLLVVAQDAEVLEGFDLLRRRPHAVRLFDSRSYFAAVKNYSSIAFLASCSFALCPFYIGWYLQAKGCDRKATCGFTQDDPTACSGHIKRGMSDCRASSSFSGTLRSQQVRGDGSKCTFSMYHG